MPLRSAALEKCLCPFYGNVPLMLKKLHQKGPLPARSCRSVSAHFRASPLGLSLGFLLLITDFIWTTSRRTIRITARGLLGS